MERITAESARMGVRFKLQAVPENVGMVRNMTDVTLFSWGPAPLMEDGRLIVSELFTNAVNATPGATVALYRTMRAVSYA